MAAVEPRSTTLLIPDLHAETSRSAKPMPPDPQAAVLDHVQTHGSISRREAVELWDLSENQAAYLLRKLVEQGKVQMVGRGRSTRYKLRKSRNKLGINSETQAAAPAPCCVSRPKRHAWMEGAARMGTRGDGPLAAEYWPARGDAVSFSEIIRTLMACEQRGIDAQEGRFFEALEIAGTFELAQDSLRIWYDSGQGVLNFARAE